MTHRPVFWIVYTLVSLLALAFAWHYFPKALPLLSLDIKMSREEALQAAKHKLGELQLAAPEARQVAVFVPDKLTQNFVELAGGGKTVFAQLLKGDLYSPYTWQVRHFLPGQVDETTIRFTPSGKAYGFRRHIPEQEPGAALGADSAQALAESRARADWAIDLASYRLIDQSQVKRNNGRVDHSFAYERVFEGQDNPIGEGRFRIRLSVAGEQLIEVTHLVHVPESFQRRFQELRSANNTLANAASLAVGLLYGLGGVAVAVVLLLRQRYLLWKPALAAAAVVAGLEALAFLSVLPGTWAGYDTALPPGTFLLKQLGTASGVFIFGGLMMGLIFMVAESLTRRAFPDHPQLWKLWTRDAAATPATLGRTVGGYLFVPVELALIVAFYFGTNTYLGWWQPSDVLSDPNILASPLPALVPIASSLQAGFMEECLFRAIPLAGAALLGERFGYRAGFIALAMIIQAIIFGAAHANYPGFPAYSRLIELIIPSLLWGMIYLRYGLLPTILLHAIFDLVLFSLPLFISTAPGLGLHRAMVIGVGVLPLIIVLCRRVQAGAWQSLALRNAHWQPAVVQHKEIEQEVYQPTQYKTLPLVKRIIPIAGLLGLVLWISVNDFKKMATPLTINRSQALAIAQQALSDRGVKLDEQWSKLVVLRLARDDATQWLWHKYVWREAGPQGYSLLLGNYLAPPLWLVRFARFEGDIVLRAEEWRITVAGEGTLRQEQHLLPESAPGVRLSQEQARSLVEKFLRERFGLDVDRLKPIAAEETKQPARVDWYFSYADPNIIGLAKAVEPRLAFALAGDEIISYGRSIHVPEEWQRAERERASQQQLLTGALSVLMLAAGLAVLIFLVIWLAKKQYQRRLFFAVLLLIFLLGCVSSINDWQVTGISLKTTEPLFNQLSVRIASQLVGLLFISLIAALLVSVVMYRAQNYLVRDAVAHSTGTLFGYGLALGVAGKGLEKAVDSLLPKSDPPNPAFDWLNSEFPLYAALSSSLRVTLLMIAGLLLLYLLLNQWSKHGERKRWLISLIMLGVGLFFSLQSIERGWWALFNGLAIAIIFWLQYALVLRHDLRLLPASLAAWMVLQQIIYAFTHAQFATTLLAGAAAAMSLLVAYWWTYQLAILKTNRN